MGFSLEKEDNCKKNEFGIPLCETHPSLSREGFGMGAKTADVGTAYAKVVVIIIRQQEVSP